MFRNAFWVLAAVLVFCQNASADDNNGQLKEICDLPGYEFLDGRENEAYKQSHSDKEMEDILRSRIDEGAKKGEKFSDVLLRTAEELWKPIANSPVCDGIPDGDYVVVYDLYANSGKEQEMTLTVTVQDKKVSEKLKITKYSGVELIQALDQETSKGKKSYSLDLKAINLRLLASQSVSTEYDED